VVDKRKEFEDKQFVNRFCELVGRLDSYWEDVLKDPITYLKIAERDILKKNEILYQIQDACRDNIAIWNPNPLPIFEGYKQISIPLEEYEKYKKIMEIIKGIEI